MRYFHLLKVIYSKFANTHCSYRISEFIIEFLVENLLDKKSRSLKIVLISDYTSRNIRQAWEELVEIFSGVSDCKEKKKALDE